ncbi:unnamed protein product, partial [Mesorhabditis spiculigera]
MITAHFKPRDGGPAKPPPRAAIFKIPQASPARKSLGFKAKVGNNNKQYVLDAGQAEIGTTRCLKCDMVYSVDCPKDVREHDEYHAGQLAARPFLVTYPTLSKWKRDSRHDSQGNVTIFRVTPETSGLRRRFDEVVEDFVNEEIGFNNALPVWNQDRQRFGCLAVIDKKIVGVAIFDLLHEASWEKKNEIFLKPNILGVNRIWVHPLQRGKRVGHALLDAGRTWAVPGLIIQPQMVAFSEPTDDGARLAAKYCSHDDGDYLVYRLRLDV